MAELCMDMGVGRPSSRTEESVTKSVEWKVQQRSVRQTIRERHKSRFLPNAEKEVGEDEAETEGAAARRLREGAEEGGEEGEEREEASGIENLRANRYAAQVRMDENGEIIMDDLTLSVDRYEAAAEEVPTGDYQVIEEAERDRFVNGHTWSKRLSGQRWSREETDLFYHVRRSPRSFGSDADGRGSMLACGGQISRRSLTSSQDGRGGRSGTSTTPKPRRTLVAWTAYSHIRSQLVSHSSPL